MALPAKGLALLALLAAEPGQSLTRSRLGGLLWGEFDASRSNANLRQTLSRIRKIESQIGATFLIVDSRVIGLDARVISTDLAEALAVDEPDTPGPLDDATLDFISRLAARELLAGLDIRDSAFDEWRARTSDRVRRLALTALYRALAAVSPSPAKERREQLARFILDIDRTSEPAYRALMEIYDAGDNQALALQSYLACRKALRDELGIEPDIVTRRLAAQLGFAELSLGTRSESTGAAADADGGKRDPHIPCVLVLPPVVAFEDASVSRLSAALMEDVIAGLSRFRSFVVLAPYTSQRISSPTGQVSTQGKTIDAQYQVSSSITPGSEGLRIGFRLMRCAGGETIWAIGRDFHLDRLPMLFSQVTHQIIYSLADAIESADRKVPFVTKNATAYRLYLEGRIAMRGTGLVGIRAARKWFRSALDLTPDFAPAIAGLSRTLTMERLVRAMADDEMLKKALALANKASAADPFDGRGLRERGFTSLYLKRHDESLASFEHAAELNPSDADLFADYADALAHSGQPQMALRTFRKASALNPVWPDYYYWILGSIHFQVEAYEEALAALQPVRENPETARLMSACFALLGNQDEARRHAAIVRETHPGFRLDDLMGIVPDRFRSDTQRMIHGLRSAGLT